MSIIAKTMAYLAIKNGILALFVFLKAYMDICLEPNIEQDSSCIFIKSIKT